VAVSFYIGDINISILTYSVPLLLSAPEHSRFCVRFYRIYASIVFERFHRLQNVTFNYHHIFHNVTLTHTPWSRMDTCVEIRKLPDWFNPRLLSLSYQPRLAISKCFKYVIDPNVQYVDSVDYWPLYDGMTCHAKSYRNQQADPSMHIKRANNPNGYWLKFTFLLQALL
jgi:hypothetical protein